MNLAFAITIGALFGTGVYLLLQLDLLRAIVGIVLVSNSANLTLMASGLRIGQPPILPLAGDEPVADPLVQAMTLTALVIGFAVTALLLAIAVRVYRQRHSIDLAELGRQEARAAEADEEEEPAHDQWREPEDRRAAREAPEAGERRPEEVGRR